VGWCDENAELVVAAFLAKSLRRQRDPLGAPPDGLFRRILEHAINLSGKKAILFGPICCGFHGTAISFFELDQGSFF